MREIKFRAWDKKRSLFIGSDYPKNWGNDKDEWYADINKMDIVGIERISNNDNFIVEQFTGQRDETGKYIYDGDILKLTNKGYSLQEATILGIVVWGFTSVGIIIKKVIQWGNYHSGTQPEIDSIIWFLSINGNMKYEVIGNIHENPELLKEAK